MTNNQSDSQMIGEYHPDFPPEAYEEEMRVLEHNAKAIEKGIDLKKLISMAEPEEKKK